MDTIGANTKTFDDPARDHWQQPERVITALAIATNASVVDVGSGTGYFAVRLARSVPQGRVPGIDIQPDMVRYLNQRAHREGLANLASQQGAKDDPKLPWPIDLAVVVDTYHHIGGRDQYFRRVREKLKPGGRLVVIDSRQDAVLGGGSAARPPRAMARCARPASRVSSPRCLMKSGTNPVRGRSNSESTDID